MKLTNQNIQDLYKFTRQHFVEHYDVQTELVDHLANDIEQIWEEKPNLTFREARDISFKKFGVFGFMNVVEEKQKQLSKKYFKILLRFVKDWFRLPKIIITMSIFLLSYSLLAFEVGQIIFMATIIILAIGDLFLGFKLRKKAKNREKKNNKKWMLEEMIFTTASISAVLIVSNILQIINAVDDVFSFWGKSLFSLLLTVTIIYSYITIIVIPKKAEELLEEHYPEYKIV